MINMTSSAPHALQIVTQVYHDWHLHIRSAIQFVELYHRGVPNSPRGAPQGARFPQCILLGSSNIARVFCAGVPWSGEAKFPMIPAGNVYKCARIRLAKIASSKILPRTLRANFWQLHHRHQAGPDHSEIASSGPGYIYSYLYTFLYFHWLKVILHSCG